MKRKVFFCNYQMLALCLTLALGLAAPAAAQDFSSFYVTPKIMTSYQRGDMNGNYERGSVFGLGLSLGSDLSYSSSLPIRMEAEYLYHGNQTFTNDINHEISAHSILANAFLDIQTDTYFTPYFGGGAGLAVINDRVTNSDSTKTSRWNFAWNLGGGLAWSINENLALDIGYRYMDLGKAETVIDGSSNAHNFSLTAHEIGLGLRIMGF